VIDWVVEREYWSWSTLSASMQLELEAVTSMNRTNEWRAAADEGFELALHSMQYEDDL